MSRVVAGIGLLLLYAASAVSAAELPNRENDTSGSVSGPEQLHGRLCNWGSPATAGDGSGHGSWFDFDGNGQLHFTSEPTIGDGALLAYDDKPDDSVGGHYRISGQRVALELDDGTKAIGRVHGRDEHGRINELLINGNRYAMELCK